MAEETPNAEQLSLDKQNEEATVSLKEEEGVSVPDEFKSQGKIDPEDANSIQGEPKEVTPEAKAEAEKAAADKVEADKVEAEKKGDKPNKKGEHLSDEDRDQKLFGEEKKEEKGQVVEDKAEKDLAGAQDKFFEQFEKAYTENDEKALADIDKTVEAKPKLVEKVSETYFDQWSEKIKGGDKEALQKLASLSNTNPKVADAIASKFWRGEVDEKKFFDGSKNLFEFIGFAPEAPAKPEGKSDEEKSEETKGAQEKTILELNLKLADVAFGKGQSLEEFKKTPLYDQFIDEASKFTKNGMPIDDFWDTVKKAVLSDTEDTEKKEVADDKKLNNAAFSSPSGGGDDKGKKGGDAISSADDEMLDAFGVDKDKVKARIAKNKK